MKEYESSFYLLLILIFVSICFYINIHPIKIEKFYLFLKISFIGFIISIVFNACIYYYRKFKK
jgi:hypothetical protein